MPGPRRLESWAEAKGASPERRPAGRRSPREGRKAGTRVRPKGQGRGAGRKAWVEDKAGRQLRSNGRREVAGSGLSSREETKVEDRFKAGLTVRRKPSRQQRRRAGTGDEIRRHGLGGPVARPVRGRADEEAQADSTAAPQGRGRRGELKAEVQEGWAQVQFEAGSEARRKPNPRQRRRIGAEG